MELQLAHSVCIYTSAPYVCFVVVETSQFYGDIQHCSLLFCLLTAVTRLRNASLWSEF